MWTVPNLMLITQLPWYSDPTQDFPRRSRKRRPQKRLQQARGTSVELPQRSAISKKPIVEQNDLLSNDPTVVTFESQRRQNITPNDTPETSQAPSEAESTLPTTPSSTNLARSQQPTSATRSSTKIVPAVPLIPSSLRALNPSIRNDTSKTSQTAEVSEAGSQNSEKGPSANTPESAEHGPPAPKAPKSWAELVRLGAPRQASTSHLAPPVPNSLFVGSIDCKSLPLGELLGYYSASASGKNSHVAFFRPRGLVNTGNVCYMNSVGNDLSYVKTHLRPVQVLQVLLFCAPFFDFLDQINTLTAQDTKTKTPMIDALSVASLHRVGTLLTQ